MMRGWFRKTEKVTAATARRITGISTPFGGLQWTDPGPAELETVRGFLVFLEDRRVLFNPYDLEVPGQVHHSVHEIRHECTDVLRRIGATSFAAVPIRAIREACRRFHDDENMDFRFFDRPDHHGTGVGFFVALGAVRATVGQQVALLAGHYDIDIEGDLASVLPTQDTD
jgi:hypothetical protein